MKRIASFVIGSILLTSTWVAAETPQEETTASKALAYLKTEGQKWIDRRGCVSCHQIPAMLWSLDSASRSGLDVADEDLKKWKEWSTQPVNFVKPPQKEDFDLHDTLAGNIDTMAALMLAIPGESDAPWRNQFADKLCQEQADDGSWKACGQLPAQKRPKLETTQATTLWVTLALLRHGSDAFDVESAVQFADGGPQAASTEWFAVRMLVAAEQGEDPDRFHKQLIASQNEDGGWGWLTENESDALATGIVLYALAEIGEQSSPAISSARQFLADSQQPSGAWKVPGTKANAKGKPTPTSNYWGTAWAVVGLVSTE